MLGLYYGDGTIAATDALIGRKPQIHLVYYAWTDPWEQGAKSNIASWAHPARQLGAGCIDFANIVNGSLDATINARAKGAKNLGQKFFLDFAAEMNGDEAWSGNNAPLYVSAYKHIAQFIRCGGGNQRHLGLVSQRHRYERDQCHDSGLLPRRQLCRLGGRRWLQLGRRRLADLPAGIQKYFPAGQQKPIIIGEMASAEQGGDKGKWIDAMIPVLKAQYPLFKAVVWFDINKENDWRINSSTAALSVLKSWRRIRTSTPDRAPRESVGGVWCRS